MAPDQQRVDAEPGPRQLLLGEEFPHLEVQTTQGPLSLPDEFAGEWFVLFSHPGDFTPVCTTEFVAFERRRDQFDELGVNLVGLSVDRVHSHMKWAEWIEDELDEDIDFPIVADEVGRVATRLGMLHPEMGTSTVRAVFVVDPEGVVRLTEYYPMEIGRNVDEILRSIRALQTADENDVALPAGWPDNDVIRDKVLLPPPSDEAGMATRWKGERRGEYECRDWWFCYRER